MMVFFSGTFFIPLLFVICIFTYLSRVISCFAFHSRTSPTKCMAIPRIAIFRIKLSPSEVLNLISHYLSLHVWKITVLLLFTSFLLRLIVLLLLLSVPMSLMQKCLHPHFLWKIVLQRKRIRGNTPEDLVSIIRNGVWGIVQILRFRNKLEYSSSIDLTPIFDL